MTPGRPAARPAGLYVHRPTPVRAIGYTGDNLAEVCSFFGRVLDTVDLPGAPRCIPLATRTGTVYAHPGDVIIESVRGELYPCADDEFARLYLLKETQPA